MGSQKVRHDWATFTSLLFQHRQLFCLHWKSIVYCVTFINCISKIFWITCCGFCCLPCTFILWRWLFFLKPYEPTSASFKLFFAVYSLLWTFMRLDESLGPYSELDFGFENVVTGWSTQAVLLSHHLCTNWISTFNCLKENVLCSHHLASCLVWERPSFQPISAFDMPSSLSLIIFSFRFKVRVRVRITKTWHRDTKWANAFGNMVWVEFLKIEGPESL